MLNEISFSLRYYGNSNLRVAINNITICAQFQRRPFENIFKPQITKKGSTLFKRKDFYFKSFTRTKDELFP